MKRIRFVIDQGERLPRGWGVAWWRMAQHQVVALPIPLSLVAGAAWKAYWTLARGFRPGRLWVAESQVATLLGQNLDLNYRIVEIQAARLEEERANRSLRLMISCEEGVRDCAGTAPDLSGVLSSRCYSCQILYWRERAERDDEDPARDPVNQPENIR